MSQEEQEQEEPHPNQAKPCIFGMVKEKIEFDTEDQVLYPTSLLLGRDRECCKVFSGSMGG